VRTFFGYGEKGFLDTSALCGAKNFGFFEIYGVPAQTRREGVEPVQTFFEQGERGQFYRDFVHTLFMDGPLCSMKLFSCLATKSSAAEL